MWNILSWFSKILIGLEGWVRINHPKFHKNIVIMFYAIWFKVLDFITTFDRNNNKTGYNLHHVNLNFSKWFETYKRNFWCSTKYNWLSKNQFPFIRNLFILLITIWSIISFSNRPLCSQAIHLTSWKVSTCSFQNPVETKFWKFSWS